MWACILMQRLFGRWKVTVWIQRKINKSINKKRGLPSYHSLTRQDSTQWRESTGREKMNPPKVQVRGTLAIESTDRKEAVWTALTFEGTESRRVQNRGSSCSSAVFHRLTFMNLCGSKSCSTRDRSVLIFMMTLLLENKIMILCQ